MLHDLVNIIILILLEPSIPDMPEGAQLIRYEYDWNVRGSDKYFCLKSAERVDSEDCWQKRTQQREQSSDQAAPRGCREQRPGGQVHRAGDEVHLEGDQRSACLAGEHGHSCSLGRSTQFSGESCYYCSMPLKLNEQWLLLLQDLSYVGIGKSIILRHIYSIITKIFIFIFMNCHISLLGFYQIVNQISFFLS